MTPARLYMSRANAARERVILFGAGLLGQRVLQAAESFDVVAFADNDPEKQNRGFCGRPVWGIQPLLDRAGEWDRVIITSGAAREIRRQLLEAGVREERIGLYLDQGVPQHAPFPWDAVLSLGLVVPALAGAAALIVYGMVMRSQRGDLVPPAPLVFDRETLRPVWFGERPVRAQFGDALRATLCGAPVPRLLRADSPARAVRLVLELVAWGRFRVREMRALARLRRHLGHEYAWRTRAPAAGPVVLAITDLAPGGAQRQLCNLALALTERGHRVQVLTTHRLSREGGAIETRLSDAGIPVLRLGDAVPDADTVEEALLRGVPPWLQVAMGRTSALCARVRPRALVAFMDEPNVVVGLGALLAGVPRVVVSFRLADPARWRAAEGWYRRYYRLLFSSSRVVASGNSEHGNCDYAHWLGLPPASVRLLRNGLDTRWLDSGPVLDPAAVRRSLGLGDSARLVCGVFRLTPQKRPDRFVQVLGRLCERFADLHGVVVGDGPLRALVERQADAFGLTERLHLVGMQDDVRPYLNASDLVLHTADLEGTPNAVLEAQYLERPVVTTRAGGAGEAVLDGETGFVVPDGDEQRLAERAGFLLEHPRRAKEMGKRGRAFVIREYSLAASVGRLESWLD